MGHVEDGIAELLEAQRILTGWISNAILDHENGWMEDAEYRDFCHGADVMMRALRMNLDQQRHLRGQLGIISRKRKQD